MKTTRPKASIRQPRLPQSWSDEQKLRIVEESLSGPRLGTATARRHGISGQRLAYWRKQYANGRFDSQPKDGFVPVRVADIPFGSTVPCLVSAASSSRVVIEAKNGRRVLIEGTVDVDLLVRVVRALETGGLDDFFAE